jgi:hypothetical protein
MTTPTTTRTVALPAATWQKLRILQAVHGNGVMKQIEDIIDRQYAELIKNGLPPIDVAASKPRRPPRGGRP